MAALSESTHIRIGFIGAGNWAVANHIPLLSVRDNVQLVAVCALDVNVLNDLKIRYGFQLATTDYRELLTEQVALDAVVISTPHSLHYTHARAALEAGLHVMVEKPITTHAAEAWELVTLANSKARHLIVPYGWHYKAIVQSAKTLISEIGQVEFVQCHMSSALRTLFSGQPWPYTADGIPDPEPNTYSDPTVSEGGQGFAQLSHSLGLLLWLTDLRAAEVFALMSKPDAHVDLYDALSIRFVGGAIGAVSGAGTLPPSRPRHQLDLRISGSEGMLLLDLERERLEVLRNDGQHITQDFESGAGSYDCDGPPNRFIDLIRQRTRENLSTGELAARVVEVLETAYRSASSGKLESVALDLVQQEHA
ncbi:MAG: Gfo/Idh/MocA family oxidoreductase [Anaerolineae bacterium]|nr:Gfo/Idh/MocA family oxidoreductase [Anaerolineae bacterium]